MTNGLAISDVVNWHAKPLPNGQWCLHGFIHSNNLTQLVRLTFEDEVVMAFSTELEAASYAKSL